MPKRPDFFQALLDFTPRTRLIRPGLQPIPRPTLSATPASSRPAQPRTSIIADAFSVAQRISRGQRPTPPRRNEESSLPSHVLQFDANSSSRQEATSAVLGDSDDDFEPVSTGRKKKRSVSRTNKLRNDRGSMTYRSDNKHRRGQKEATSSTNGPSFCQDNSVRRLFREEHSLSATDNEHDDSRDAEDESEEDGLEEAKEDAFDNDINLAADPIDLRGNMYGKSSGEINLQDPDVTAEPSMLQSPTQSRKRRKTKRRIQSDTDSENEIPLRINLRQEESPTDNMDDDDLPLTTLTSRSPIKNSIHNQQGDVSIDQTRKAHASKSFGTAHSNDDDDDDDDVPIVRRRVRTHGSMTHGTDHAKDDDNDDDVPIVRRRVRTHGSTSHGTDHAKGDDNDDDDPTVRRRVRTHGSKSLGTDHSKDGDDDDLPVVRRRIRTRPCTSPVPVVKHAPRSRTSRKLDDSSDDDMPLIRRHRRNTVCDDSDSADEQDANISPVKSISDVENQGRMSFPASFTQSPTFSKLENATPVSEVIELSDSLDGQPHPSNLPQTPSPFSRRSRRIELPDSTPSPPSTRKRRPRQRLQTLPDNGDELPLESPVLRASVVTKPAKSPSKNATSPSENWFCERNIEDFPDNPEFELRTPQRNAPSSAGRRRVSVHVKRSVPSGKSVKPSFREGINVVDEVESLCDSEDLTESPTPVKRKRQTTLEPVFQQDKDDSIQIVENFSLPSPQGTQKKRRKIGRQATKLQPMQKKSKRKSFTQTRLDFGSQVEPRPGGTQTPKVSKKKIKKTPRRKEDVSEKDTFFKGSKNTTRNRPAAPVNSEPVVVLDDDEEDDFVDLVDVPNNIPNLYSANGRAASRASSDAALNSANNFGTDKPPPFNLVVLCENGESVLQMMERLGEEFVIDKITMAQKEGREIVGGEELGITPQALSQTREGDFSRFMETVVPDGIGKETEMHSVTEQAMRGEFQFNYRGRGTSPPRNDKRVAKGRTRGRGGRRYYARRWRGRRK